MTRARSAKLAGFMFLFYIAVGVTDLVLFAGKTPAEGTVANLSHVVLSLLACFSAPVLAAGLYGITRVVDHEMALLAMSLRVGEGVIGATGIVHPQPSGALLSAMFFAVGSTIFCWLLLKVIPRPLAWLGVAASVLLVALLPAQIAGVLHGPLTQLAWIPMAAFEVSAAVWLLVRGAALPEV